MENERPVVDSLSPNLHFFRPKGGERRTISDRILGLIRTNEMDGRYLRTVPLVGRGICVSRCGSGVINEAEPSPIATGPPFV
jgi:hypothetical protein